MGGLPQIRQGLHGLLADGRFWRIHAAQRLPAWSRAEDSTARDGLHRLDRNRSRRDGRAGHPALRRDGGLPPPDLYRADRRRHRRAQTAHATVRHRYDFKAGGLYTEPCPIVINSERVAVLGRWPYHLHQNYYELSIWLWVSLITRQRRADAATAADLGRPVAGPSPRFQKNLDGGGRGDRHARERAPRLHCPLPGPLRGSRLDLQRRAVGDPRERMEPPRPP